MVGRLRHDLDRAPPRRADALAHDRRAPARGEEIGSALASASRSSSRSPRCSGSRARAAQTRSRTACSPARNALLGPGLLGRRVRRQLLRAVRLAGTRRLPHLPRCSSANPPRGPRSRWRSRSGSPRARRPSRWSGRRRPLQPGRRPARPDLRHPGRDTMAAILPTALPAGDGRRWRRVRGRGAGRDAERAGVPERRTAPGPRLRGCRRGGLHLQRPDGRPCPGAGLPGVATSLLPHLTRLRPRGRRRGGVPSRSG